MLFTIFTPTYNRAYILPKLYDSLLMQANQNFEWLIIDDGSTDNTELLINEYIKENKIPIRYFKQKNQGKHIAINSALEKVELPWFCIIDSDDHLEAEASKVWEQLANEISDTEKAGFSFIHFSDKILYDRTKYGKKRLVNKNDYLWEFQGEMLFCFKSEIIKKYSFPVYSGEKFCQESVLFLPIFKKFKFLFTDFVLVRGEYMKDGLSQNLYQRLLENPRYAMLSFRTKLNVAKTSSEKEQLANNYWDIALKNENIPWSEKLAGLNLKWTFKVFKNKLLKRINR